MKTFQDLSQQDALLLASVITGRNSNPAYSQQGLEHYVDFGTDRFIFSDHHGAPSVHMHAGNVSHAQYLHMEFYEAMIDLGYYDNRQHHRSYTLDKGEAVFFIFDSAQETLIQGTYLAEGEDPVTYIVQRGPSETMRAFFEGLCKPIAQSLFNAVMQNRIEGIFDGTL